MPCFWMFLVQQSTIPSASGEFLPRDHSRSFRIPTRWGQLPPDQWLRHRQTTNNGAAHLGGKNSPISNAININSALQQLTNSATWNLRWFWDASLYFLLLSTSKSCRKKTPNSSWFPCWVSRIMTDPQCIIWEFLMRIDPLKIDWTRNEHPQHMGSHEVLSWRNFPQCSPREVREQDTCEGLIQVLWRIYANDTGDRGDHDTFFPAGKTPLNSRRTIKTCGFMMF